MQDPRLPAAKLISHFIAADMVEMLLSELSYFLR